jgi:hypothetical protein
MTTSSANTSFFMNAQERALGQATPADDRMHREANSLVSDVALVETQYLGFSIPEANIHALNYTWLHPNIGTASGGAWVWQGTKPGQHSSEIFDMRDFMPISTVGELDSYTLPSGYRVEVVKPLEEIHISYHDPARDSSFDITYTAIMPPAMLASGKHFDQAMRTKGTLRLHGTDHKVDGFTVRDRSWAEARPEAPRQAPPVHYLTSVFDEDFAFNVTGIEDPDGDPLWKSVADLSSEQVEAFNRGWVWRNGELKALASAKIATEWDRSTGYPMAHAVDFVDSSGGEYSVTGAVGATCHWNAWSNAFLPVGLTRWRFEDKVGWGDSQSVAWTDYVRHVRG